MVNMDRIGIAAWPAGRAETVVGDIEIFGEPHARLLSGSPVQQGEALRLLDMQSGDHPEIGTVGSLRPAIWNADSLPVELLQVQDQRSAGRINLLEHEGRGIPPSHKSVFMSASRVNS